MAYASAGLIEAVDYNTMANTVASQLGMGTSFHGYGQNVTGIANVAGGVPPTPLPNPGGTLITAAQWTNLISSINTGLSHQGVAAITPASVTAGNNITYYAPINTGATAVYNGSGTTGLALTDGAANTTSYSSAWGTTGSRSLAFTQTLTFSSGDAARYFFNAGGKVKLTFARSGGSATTRNTEWTALATACGVISLGWKNTTKTGGSGTITTLLNTDNGGYWAGTGTYAVHFKQLDNVGSYSTNYIQVQYYWSGTAANGGYPILNIKTTWANPWVNAFQDAVDGTASTSLVVSSPATTYLTNTWGTPTFGGSVAQV